MLYKILTEDKNQEGIVDIIKEHFDEFTLIPAIGYWQGIKENSLIIEIDAGTDMVRIIIAIIYAIKELNKQQAVMVQYINESESELI